MAGENIVLFDGVCIFCSRSILFVLKRDRRGRFLFAPLQSEAAAGYLEKHGRAKDDLSSMVLIQGGRLFQKSTAVLRIGWGLSFPWPLFSFLILIPRPVRDFLYDWFARNRYRWFGKRESCFVPAPEWRDRFLG